jgi:two-component system, NarL family, sensor kinase
MVLSAERLDSAGLSRGHGARQGTPVCMPLRHRGEDVGALVLERRPGTSDFTPSERRLLADLAAQIGVAVEAVALTRALQRSRERLVVAREEERRRLRRDLHDGLGPALTASTMKIDRIRGRLEQDPEQADRLLSELRAEVKAAIDDIRRLVYELRPPALDELGLMGALREQAARFASDGRNGDRLYVDFYSPEALPELPAAAEVAAYRIASEALTKAARHSGARRCNVRIALDGDLYIEVNNDGVWPEDWRPGVGISSMRERAGELGGTLSVGPAPGGGGRVAARIPLGSR